MNKLARHQQNGFSLVELMVATTISLLLLGGVVQVFLSSKKMYSTNTAMARVQENGRFATEFVAFDIRNAGYKGDCLGDPVNHLDTSSADYKEDHFDLGTPIKGWDENDTTAPDPMDTRRSKTDSFIIKYAGSGEDFTGKSGAGSKGPNLGVASGKTGIFAGQIVMLGNSEGCEIFQNTNNGNAATFQTSGGNVKPGNKKVDSWTQDYSNKKFMAYKLQSHGYYLKDNTNNRLPSLYRKRLSDPDAVAEELIEGVIDMQIIYGIDTNLDRQIDKYSKAGATGLTSAADWEKVVAARIDFLIVSPESNVIDEPLTFFFPAAKGITKEDAFAKYVDGTVTIKGNRLAHVFSTTIGIRNRLP